MVQTRLSRVRSSSSQALVWSQSRHRHVCGFQMIRIGGPFLRKIQRAVDERMTMARNVGSEHSDLAVRNLACRTRVLPRHSARRLALFEKAGLVDHQHCIVIRQMLDDIVAHDIAQGISVPIPTTQNCLLPPWARIASGLRPLPTGLARLISEQTFQEQTRIRRHTLLREQRTYPFLDLSKRRRPQRKRLLNRRCLRPRLPNHGCPWIQTFPKEATVMLESVRRLHAGLQSFLSMRRIEARRKNASAFRLRFSQSLASLRQRLSHAMVRSTIQRLGKTTNPLT